MSKTVQNFKIYYIYLCQNKENKEIVAYTENQCLLYQVICTDTLMSHTVVD